MKLLRANFSRGFCAVAHWVLGRYPPVLPLLGLLVLLGAGCPATYNMPIARDGVVDLRDWDFERDGPVLLHGDWQLCWSHLYEDGKDGCEGNTHYVPSVWTWAEDSDIQRHGYGTYYLRVLLPPEPPSGWMIVFGDIDTAHRFRILGANATLPEQPVKSGQVGRSSLDTIPLRSLTKTRFRANDAITIAVEVANYTAWSGGMWRPPQLGAEVDVQRNVSLRRFGELATAGFIFMIGLYHLLAFMFLRRDQSTALFATLCLIISVRVVLVGRMPEDWFPETTYWWLLYKIEFLTFYTGVPIFVALVASLLPDEAPPWLCRPVYLIFSAASLAIILLPPPMYALSLTVLRLIAVAAAVAITGVIIRSAWKHQDAISVLLMLGAIAVAGGGVFDVWNNANMTARPPMVHYATAIFAFLQAATIGLVQLRARAQAEDLSRALSHSNDKLQRQIAQRIQIELALTDARNRAESANRSKSRFLLTIGHELRTPLNAIIGYTELVQEELEDGVEAEELVPDVGRVETSARHLLSILSDLMSTTHSDEASVEVKHVEQELSTFLDELVHSLEPKLLSNHNVFHLDLSPNLGSTSTDFSKLRMILLHLLSNAAKFTDHGRITFSAYREGDSIVFEVTDTGIGIAHTDLGRIFEPLTQVDDSATRRYGGTGMGLSVAKQFTQLIGGKIDVASHPGKGSTFTVILPQSMPTKRI